MKRPTTYCAAPSTDSPSSRPSRTSPTTGPRKPAARARSAHSEARLEREPEPRIERRQHEHECVGLEHCQPDRDDPEHRQGGDESGEPFVGGRRRARQQVPCARRAIRARRRRPGRGAPKTGGLSRNDEYGGSGSGAPVGRIPASSAEPDEHAAEHPDAETRALRAQRPVRTEASGDGRGRSDRRPRARTARRRG